MATPLLMEILFLHSWSLQCSVSEGNMPTGTFLKE
jgi:hypothetical protein